MGSFVPGRDLTFQDIFVPERVSVDLEGANVQQVLRNASRFISSTVAGFSGTEIYYYLAEREKKGSTALGRGVAIPHCRIANCSVEMGALFKLNQPVDFVAADRQPVDLLCILLVPELDRANEQHLRLLAMLVRRFSDDEYCKKLRATTDSAALYKVAVA